MKRRMSKINHADYLEEDKSSGLAPEIAEVGENEDELEMDLGENTEISLEEEDGAPAIEIEKKIPLKKGQYREIENLRSAFQEGDDKRPGFMGKAAVKIKAALDKVNKV